jgi:hypothetical protein
MTDITTIKVATLKVIPIKDIIAPRDGYLLFLIDLKYLVEKCKRLMIFNVDCQYAYNI